MDGKATLADSIAAALGKNETLWTAYLFGSRARGRFRENSDLDLGVQFRPDLDAMAREQARREVVATLADALGAVGASVDLVDLERTDSAVAFRAIREGMVVREHTRAGRVLLEAAIARRYDDDAPKRRLFEAAARRVAAGWASRG